PHGRVDRLREKELQARAVQHVKLPWPAGRAAEQPAGDRDAVQRAAQRRQAVWRADPALGASLLERPAARLGAGRRAHGVATLDHLCGESPAPTAAADDQYPRHGAPSYDATARRL